MKRNLHGLALCLLPALLCALGCGATEPTAHGFGLSLHARTPRGEPVVGARFFANGSVLGVTDEHGELTASVSGREDETVLITQNCPSGYRERSQPRPLQLRAYVAADPSHGQRLSLDAVCEREQRRAALVVRALRGDRSLSLPIRVDGELLAQTGPDGTSHVLLTVSPHHNVRVALDSSVWPRLRPESPVRTFPIDDDQDVLLFDQRFTDEPQRPRPPRPAHNARPHAPYRIQ
jgi:hypothetical protein